MFRAIIIFVGGVVTGAAMILGLDDKEDSTWEEYKES